jgi:hypothetical protein
MSADAARQSHSNKAAQPSRYLYSLARCECEERIPSRDGDVLAAVDGISYRAGKDASAERGFPQQIAVACVEGDEMAIAPAGED